MANDASKQSASLWPLPKFSFVVSMEGIEIYFQEVTGLDAETQVIEYRSGSSKTFSTVKMPGIKKVGNVTLKRGIFKGDKVFFDVYDKIKMNTFKRQTITISLLDKAQKVAMSWTLLNAFPVKITTSDLKSDGNEVAIETLELALEGLKIISS